MDLETIRRKLVAIGDSQRTLARQARSSLSILNVTRIDLAKNRQTINRQDIKDELEQMTRSMSVELQKLEGFEAQFMQLLMAINRLKQTSQALQLSLEHVIAQLDMLSLGHLSPSIVTPGHLRDILLKIQAALPHILRLPPDPSLGLWRYYNSPSCIILIEDTKLLALVPILLLNRGSIFEVFQTINLSIPYPGTKRELGVTAKYKLEATCIALNPARTKFMLLTAPEAENAGWTCWGPVYPGARYIALDGIKYAYLGCLMGKRRRLNGLAT